MATVHGKDGVIKIGANSVAEVQSFDLDLSTKLAEHDSMGDPAVLRKAGIDDSKGSISCLWDKSDATGQETLKNGTSVALELYPEGTASGDKKFAVPAIVANFKVTATKGDIVKADFTFEGNGLVVESLVA